MGSEVLDKTSKSLLTLKFILCCIVLDQVYQSITVFHQVIIPFFLRVDPYAKCCTDDNVYCKPFISSESSKVSVTHPHTVQICFNNLIYMCYKSEPEKNSTDKPAMVLSRGRV